MVTLLNVTTSEFKSMNGFFKFILWANLVFNALTGVFCVVLTAISEDYMDQFYGFLVAIGCFATVLGAYLLLNWNKVGYFILSIGSIVLCLLLSVFYDMSIEDILGMVFYAIFITLLLFTKGKEGETAWYILFKKPMTESETKKCNNGYKIASAAGVFSLIVLLASSMVHSKNSQDLDSFQANIKNIEKLSTKKATIEEKCTAMLEETLQEINQNYPEKIGQLNTIEKVGVEGSYVVYDYTFDEDIIEYDELYEMHDELLTELKNNMLSPEMLNDAEVKYFIRIVIKANKGIRTRYTGCNSGKSFYVSIPAHELKQIFEQNYK